MNKMRKYLSVLLSLTMLLLLFAACSSNSEEDANGDNSSTVDIGPRPTYEVPLRKRPQELFLNLKITHFTITPYDNGVFAYGTTKDEPEKEQFYFCNLEDGSITKSGFVLDDFLVLTYQAMSDGSLIVGGYHAQFDEYRTPVSMDTYSVYHLTAEDTVPIIKMEDDVATLRFTINEQEKKIYFEISKSGKYSVRIYSLSGELVNEVASDTLVRDLVYSSSSNTVYAIQTSGSDLSIHLLDEDQKTLKEIARLPNGATGARVHHNSEYGFIVEHWSKVMAFNCESKTFVELFDISRQGISGRIPSIIEYNDYYIVLVINDATIIPKIFKIIINEEYDGPVEVLRVGKFEMGRDIFLEDVIAEFNFYNPQFLVEITDYSAHGDEAATMLHMDIIKGVAPDIFLLAEPIVQSNFLPVHQYINSGMLVDISPYMKRDLDYNLLWTNALQTLYMDNACYIAVPSFGLYSFVGRSAAIESIKTDSLLDLLEIITNGLINQKSIFTADMTQGDFVIDIVLSNMNEFVNYSTGEVMFESEEFITLLDTAKKLIPDEKSSRVRLVQGDGELTLLKIDTFGQYSIYAEFLNGDFASTGFYGSPPGVALIPGHIFGISSGTKNIEGAWSFIRSIYENDNLPGNQYARFPMNKMSFELASDNYIEKLTEYIIDDGGGYHIYDDNHEFFVPFLNSDQIEKVATQISDLIDQIDRIYLVDQYLMNIILEELPAFFAGNKSAVETAKVIQSRAQIYLWELK